jgi:hypothetical protein
VAEAELVGRTVVEGRRTIFEEGGDLGLDRAEHEQPTRHRICARREQVDLVLKKRAELSQPLAIEVLELVERDDVPCSCKLAETIRPAAGQNDLCTILLL